MVRRITSGTAAAALVLGCASGAASPEPRTPTTPTTPAPPAAGPAVQVWLTTADQSQLLARQADLRFGGDTAAGALPVIAVDEGTTYQSMVGFGAAFTDAAVYLIQEKMSAAQRETLLQDLFGRTSGASGVGLSFARTTMGASDFSLRQYSYDDVVPGRTDSALASFSVDADRADKLPVIERALAINPRLTLVASPWSPPAWMKTSGSLIKGTLRPEAYDAFARYFVKYVQAYAAEGVPIAAVTIQNEPQFEPEDYPGMRLDAAQRAAIVGGFVGPAFAKAGLTTQIWDWDHNWDQPQQPLGVLADSAARRYVRAVAWHCYAGDVGAQTPVRDAAPDKDVYMTECSGGDWATVFGDNLKFDVGTLIIGATRNWARGVALWNLALDEHDGPHTGGCANCRGVVTVNSATGAYTRNVEYFALGHASKFVRPGAVRVASSSDVQGLSSVAFRNADDGSKVLLVLNGATESRKFVLRAGAAALTYTLPAGAVATFTWGAA